MRIREINVMKGPNYWSIRRHKLIVMVLDLEDLEQKPTNHIPGFLERMKDLRREKEMKRVQNQKRAVVTYIIVCPLKRKKVKKKSFVFYD